MKDSRTVTEKMELAHDLMKPIAVIADLASRLPGELSQPKRAIRDAQRLQLISRDLVALLRGVMDEGLVDQDLANPRGGRNDISLAVEAAVRAVGLRYPGRRVDVVEAPALPRLRARGVVVRRVVENLLDNALSASGAPLPVVVRVEVAPGQVRIEVVDTGKPKGAVARADADRASGHGIGLPASRRAVEALGGSLTLLRNGSGTLARVVLPASGAP